MLRPESRRKISGEKLEFQASLSFVKLQQVYKFPGVIEQELGCKRAGILGRLCKLAPPGKSKFSRRSLLTKIRLSLHPNSSSLFTPRFRLCITIKFRLILTLEICLNSPIKAGIMPCIHSYFNYRYTKDKKERNQNSLIIYLHSLKRGRFIQFMAIIQIIQTIQTASFYILH